MGKKSLLPAAWTTLLLLASIFFFNFIARIIFSPLLPNIEADLGISHAEAGSFFLLIACGYFLSLTGSAFISCRLQHRSIIILSAMVLGVSLAAVSLCQNLWSVRIGLVVIGMAAGLYLPSAIATLTTVVQAGQWGRAIAVHELAPNLAFILAPLLAETFLHWFSWRSALIMTGLATLLLGTVFAALSRGGNFRGERPDFTSLRRIASEAKFWIMIALFSLGISSTLGVYTMLPLYLVEFHGIDQTWANTLFALSRVATLATALLGGWGADRFGVRRAMALTLGIAGILTVLLGLAASAWVVTLIFVQPLAAVAFFPAGFAALSAIGPSGSRHIVVSLTVPLAFLIGGGAVPAFIGAMASAGHFGWGFALTGLFILAGGGIALRFRSVRLPGDAVGRG